jgi:hypothetical protein
MRTNNLKRRLTPEDILDIGDDYRQAERRFLFRKIVWSAVIVVLVGLVIWRILQ